MNTLNILEITDESQLISISTLSGGHLLANDGALFDAPAPIGHYDLSGFNIALDEKPRRLHRFFARVLLGWEWCDAE